MLDVVRRLVDVGIPVMGHLGLQPQSVHQLGGYVKQVGRGRGGRCLVEDAIALEDAGAFADRAGIDPEDVARTVTQRSVDIPTIGIGAGPTAMVRSSSATTCSACSTACAVVREAVRQPGRDVQQRRAPTSTSVRAGRYPHALEARASLTRKPS